MWRMVAEALMSTRMRSFLVWVMVSAVCVFGPVRHVWAQTDEIQVYSGEINKPGQYTITLHNNYTPSGRKQPAYPGAIIPDHALNGVPEIGYGVNEWWEVGAYLPVYTITRDGRALVDSAKIRTLFAVPHAEDRAFFYAVNFELSFNAHHWEQAPVSAEIRPIIGVRFGKLDLIFNPIVDFAFRGFRSLDFAPATRIAYNFTPVWTGALEHYADFGELRHFGAAVSQAQSLFAVVDYNGQSQGQPFDIEFGVGHGFAAASDNIVLKLLVTHSF